MSGAPWTCQQCLRRLARSIVHRHARYGSNGKCNSGQSCYALTLIFAVTPRDDIISPALLSRARATATEYNRLTAQLASSFNTKSAKRLGELSHINSALQQWEQASDSLSELKGLLLDPNVDAELRDLASEDISDASGLARKAAQLLTTALVPRHPFADLPCLLEIRPGVGGSEAALFAGDLLRMYQVFCNRKGLCATLLKYEDSAGMSDPNGSDAPLQEAILEVETLGAYGILRCEAGVHRVQRVPATESKGRTHTSAATVMVLPSFPVNENDVEGGDVDVNDPNSDYYINPTSVRTDVMRASGAGGQHVNTTDSAVRLTHIPTNTVVNVQEERSQLRNRAKAWQILRARLAQAKREAREEEAAKLRRSITGSAHTGRSDKVRTYNWGQQRVTDHRSGLTVNQLDDVLEGGDSLEKVMDSVRAWLQEREIEGLLVAQDHGADVQAGTLGKT